MQITLLISLNGSKYLTKKTFSRSIRLSNQKMRKRKKRTIKASTNAQSHKEDTER